MIHWRVLAAVGAMNWGGYFIYDIPASLSTPLSAHLSLSDHNFAYLISLLYTVYAVPNTVLPFLSGPAVQRFGERSVLLVITSSIILGQLLFALSVQTRFEFGMVVGRALIGLGGEVVGVIGCEIITRWFQDKSLSLALAINLSAGRLGSVANSTIIPRVTELYGVAPATWIATALSLGVATIGALYLLTVTKPAADKPQHEDDGCTNAVDPLSIRQFSSVFWQLALISFLTYGCLNPFTNSAQRFLAVRYYHGDQLSAGSAMSIVFILSGILVPAFGLLLDSLSSASYPRVLVVSNVLLALVHAIFLTGAGTSPILPLCLLGTADALFTVCFWASVVRCLLPPATDLHVHTPLLKAEDSGSERVCGPYGPATDTPNPEEDRERLGAENLATPSGDAFRTLGVGIMTSLLNTSTALVPIPLAVMENLAGLAGLESVFLMLAFAAFLAAVRLAWI
ncbi:hypothetical protein BDW74DRAFT_176751 [Aspergillus multicolor]|uniref:uncharacterized protein n=1 Tax=Aspergillus multicolor TaxID=41759 RepID=UPI003CCCD54B